MVPCVFSSNCSFQHQKGKKGEQGPKTKKNTLPPTFSEIALMKGFTVFSVVFVFLKTLETKTLGSDSLTKRVKCSPCSPSARYSPHMGESERERLFCWIISYLSTGEVLKCKTQAVDHTSYTWVLANTSASFLSSSMGNIFSHPEHVICMLESSGSTHSPRWGKKLPRIWGNEAHQPEIESCDATEYL